jgi:hypothetical protein
MKKIFLKFALMTALTSVMFLSGCAKGGSGPCVTDCPAIVIEPDDISQAGLNVSIPLTVTFKYVSSSPVNWSITPSSCGSACGTLTNVTTTSATYVGPSTVPANPDFSIVATSQTDGSLSGSLALEITPVTAAVAPAAPNVGAGLTQQYTAVALPEQAPQTFTWSCMVNGTTACANFTPNATVSGEATYQATAGEECSSSGCITISATPTVDPTGCSSNPPVPCAPSQTTVIASRVPPGTYAFRFAGFDSNGRALAVAGTFTVATGGSISGTEDENQWNGSAFVTSTHAISGGSYTPLSGSNANSNNAGTLTLNTGVFPNTYNVVLDSAGDIQMIAVDGNGNSGSGVAEPAAVSKFVKEGAATYAFGLTGVDASNNRIGYVGILPTDGTSTVTGGLIDVNDNGSASNSVCGTAPCTVTGTYSYNSSTNQGQITLTSPKAMTFDFFVANGSSSASNPLTLYAISTDSNPAVLGTMVLQNAKQAPYTNATFKGTSVSELTGANNNVALILMTTFGDNGSGGVQGACPASNSGSLEGNFDQNNAGTILSVATFPSAAQTTNPYTYISTNGNTGRYIFCMLGNPNASTPVLPIPFVLYASGANSGFLLDQSSSSVMTGTMNVQTGPKANQGVFASSSAIGTYAVSTYSNSAPNDATCASTDSLLTGCTVIMNLLLTEPSPLVYDVTGTENPNNAVFNATYTVGGSGTGTFAPVPGGTPPATTPNYVLYGVTETTFFAIDVDTDKNGPVISPILYMAQ